MRKHFTHHFDWFHILAHVSGGDKWFYQSKLAVHVPSNLFDYDFYFHYIEKTDKLYSISQALLSQLRLLYNGRYHIAKECLEEIEITPLWRKKISEYAPKKNQEEKQITFI